MHELLLAILYDWKYAHVHILSYNKGYESSASTFARFRSTFAA